MNRTLKQKIYEATDSFLVEAKDQHGRERSLERLNKDRHLFVERMEALFQEQLDEVGGEVEKTDNPFRAMPDAKKQSYAAEFMRSSILSSLKKRRGE